MGFEKWKGFANNFISSVLVFTLKQCDCSLEELEKINSRSDYFDRIILDSFSTDETNINYVLKSVIAYSEIGNDHYKPYKKHRKNDLNLWWVCTPLHTQKSSLREFRLQDSGSMRSAKVVCECDDVDQLANLSRQIQQIFQMWISVQVVSNEPQRSTDRSRFIIIYLYINVSFF